MKLKAKRNGLAIVWMENHVPRLKDIANYDASKAFQAIHSLQKRPKLLSSDQVNEVRKAIAACEKRIDDLEIEGLFVKFQGMSDQNKKTFVKKIEKHIRALMSDIA